MYIYIIYKFNFTQSPGAHTYIFNTQTKYLQQKTIICSFLANHIDAIISFKYDWSIICAQSKPRNNNKIHTKRIIGNWCELCCCCNYANSTNNNYYTKLINIKSNSNSYKNNKNNCNNLKNSNKRLPITRTMPNYPSKCHLMTFAQPTISGYNLILNIKIF